MGREGRVTGGGQPLATRAPAPLYPPPQIRLGSHLLSADERAQPKGGAEAGKKRDTRTAGKRGAGLGLPARRVRGMGVVAAPGPAVPRVARKEISKLLARAQLPPADLALRFREGGGGGRRAPTAPGLSTPASKHDPQTSCAGLPVDWRCAEGRAGGRRVPPHRFGSPRPLPPTRRAPHRVTLPRVDRIRHFEGSL